MAAMLHLLGADSATFSLWRVAAADSGQIAPVWCVLNCPGRLLQLAQRLACAGQIQASIFQSAENVENQVDVGCHDFTHMRIQ